MSSPRTLLIVDDDELSREVLALFAAQAGFLVASAASGQDALEHLTTQRPDIVLMDMQMPGLAGDALARALRLGCGPSTVLLAMSGSGARPEDLAACDGFLLKPFTMDQLEAALAGVSTTRAQPTPAAHAILDQRIYDSLAGSIPAPQLRALYDLCLDDADRRITLMRTALATRDAEAYTRAAHAVRGGCGMVGATQLAALAATMETGPLPPVGNTAPLDEFLAASADLRRMLDAPTTFV